MILKRFLLVFLLGIASLNLLAEAEQKAISVPFVSEKKETRKYEIKAKGLKLKDLEDNQGKRYAIAIGINRYQDTGISELSKARNDAKIVGKILRDRGQFDQVFVMTDDIDPGTEPIALVRLW